MTKKVVKEMYRCICHICGETLGEAKTAEEATTIGHKHMTEDHPDVVYLV